MKSSKSNPAYLVILTKQKMVSLASSDCRVLKIILKLSPAYSDLRCRELINLLLTQIIYLASMFELGICSIVARLGVSMSASRAITAPCSPVWSRLTFGLMMLRETSQLDTRSFVHTIRSMCQQNFRQLKLLFKYAF